MTDFYQEGQLEFAMLVKEHQAGLRAFIRRLGVRKDAVDDLAQEAFLLAHLEMENFRASEDFGKWLRGLARNLVRNELRKLARRCRIVDEGLTQHLLIQAELNDDEKPYTQEDFEVLQSCLSKLPERSKHLIMNRYEDNLNATTLAEKFKMTATAVRLALMRIRKQLKVCFEKQAIDVGS